MEMTLTTTVTRDGRSWQPSYLLAINPVTCIGCGRCFKVCGRGVMELKGIDEDGRLVALSDEDEDAEIERKIMTLVDAGACIGCAACARACPKDCQTHGFA
jgi:Nif-specific ferredoxin III